MWVCKKTEVHIECKKPINLTFEGKKGTRCKWLHYKAGQEKPCCYVKGKIAVDVCSHDLATADQKNCRGGSNSTAIRPIVEMAGVDCTFTIENPNPEDVGYYEGFMPHKSEEYHTRQYVDFDQICDFTLETPCIMKSVCTILFCVSLCCLLITLFGEQILGYVCQLINYWFGDQQENGPDQELNNFQ